MLQNKTFPRCIMDISSMKIDSFFSRIFFNLKEFLIDDWLLPFVVVHDSIDITDSAMTIHVRAHVSLRSPRSSMISMKCYKWTPCIQRLNNQNLKWKLKEVSGNLIVTCNTGIAERAVQRHTNACNKGINFHFAIIFRIKPVMPLITPLSC